MRKWIVLSLVAAAMAGTATVVAQELAEARQRPIVITRQLFGFFDRRGRFVPTAGRGATNVDRNAVVLFVFNGQVDLGPNLRATLPLTLGEQAELEMLAPRIASGEASRTERQRFAELGGDLSTGFEPGVLGRRASPFRSARVVATGSVSRQSVFIATPTASGDTLATGQFFKVLRRRRGRVIPSRLVFNPSYAAATFNRPEEIDYNPAGFLPNTTYEITVDGGSSPASAFDLVRNRDGVPLAARFSRSFRTSGRYVQDFSRPEIRSVSPADGSVNVPSDADIDISFSEPMLVDSFRLPAFQADDTWTVRVRYTQDANKNGLLAGRNVLGTIRSKPQTAGDVIQFRPIQGFGRGPYEVEVTVTAAVTDLSGNTITRQQRLVFDTEFDADAEEFGIYEELYDDNDEQDTDFVPTGDYVLAAWNGGADPGRLSTTVSGVTFNATGPNVSGTAAVNVWFPVSVRFQFLFPAADMGLRPRTITGFDWDTGVFVGQTYPGTICQIGHATDLVAGGGLTGAGPVNSHFKDTPVLVHPNAPYTSASAGGSFVAGPTFVANFNSNGQDAVIVDITHGGHGGATDERWLIDNTFAINVLAFQNTAVNPPIAPQLLPWYGSTRFAYLSPGAEAQSNWIDIGIANARYLPQQIVPVDQPQGTSISFQWQGSQADPNDPLTRDPTTETLFVGDIRQLANNKFLRYKVTFLNNLATREAGAIDTTTVPYTYRP